MGTHNSVAWTESWGDNNNLLARNFPDDIGIITNTDGFQSFTAAINGYTLNPTIDWDYGYSASPINWDHADDNSIGSFNSGDWGAFIQIETSDIIN